MCRCLIWLIICSGSKEYAHRIYTSSSSNFLQIRLATDRLHNKTKRLPSPLWSFFSSRLRYGSSGTVYILYCSINRSKNSGSSDNLLPLYERSYDFYPLYHLYMKCYDHRSLFLPSPSQIETGMVHNMLYSQASDT